MAALETIRTKFGIGASIIIAIGLLLFLVNPSDIIQAVQSRSTKYDVGNIDGKRITYTEFDQHVKQFSDISEMMTGNSASSEQAQRQVREMAWQDLVQQELVVPTIQKAGIRVGKQEQVDLMVGDNVSPLIASIGMFRAEDGSFSPALVREFLEEAGENPRALILRNYLQNAVRINRYTEKYSALFEASDFQNALQLNSEVAGNNTTANVDFVAVPNSYFPMDSTVVVTPAQIKAYYKAHKEDFKQDASRDIEYAVYEVKPSASDIAAQNDEFVKLYDEFAAADNVRAFLQRNSDRQWTDRWYKDGELRSINRDVDAFVSANRSGVSPVITAGSTFFAARIMAQANVPDSVYVRHIMFQGAGARHTADSLLPHVSKGNFAALALQYSADKGNAADGEQGNLGWMSQNSMIPGFESVLTAAKNRPFIVNSQYGVHIVEVTKATAPIAKKQVAVFEKATIPSKETFASVYNQANQLASRAAGNLERYRTVCDTTGIYSRSQTISEGTDTYGGVSHAKEITRWAFDNKPGKVSNIITVDNNYFFVVAVTGAHKEGYKELSEASETIRTTLYRKAYAAKHAADVAARIEGASTLEEAAEKLGATVSQLSDVSFSTNTAASTEPAFVGAVAAAPEAALCGPVAGEAAVYLFRVNGRETGSYYTEDDARTARGRISAFNTQMLLPVMMDGTVKDNRARFY